MRTTIIASLFTILAITHYAYADTCPEPSIFNPTSNGFTAKDESGRIWEGEYWLPEKAYFSFESATYITKDEGEDGIPKTVSQMSCRYGKIAMVLDNVTDWEPISGEWDNDNTCTESIRKCSFSISNK
ncbi:hypothetical protein J2X84_000608 [Pseudomonas corrugata]|jgi:hypothetical protein|uniref:hypothetical protein n=1 Tax=Pseudomonas corrugata TaxID=47879 RepID=UPI00285D83AC|nr:hypothetical protein [Pseudomonas corrugata]MDR7281794.1 hypothetical protein [Pseudomonas corrugata]